MKPTRSIPVLTESDTIRFWSKVNTESDCWTWRGTKLPHGYGIFYVARNGIKTKYYAHRVAYSLVNGPLLPGLFVCHRCDNPSCCNPSHLFAGTQTDNMRDAKRKGRCVFNPLKGEANPHSKLKASEVLEIRRLFVRGVPGKNPRTKGNSQELANQFGISRTTVYHIYREKGWKHL